MVNRNPYFEKKKILKSCNFDAQEVEPLQKWNLHETNIDIESIFFYKCKQINKRCDHHNVRPNISETLSDLLPNKRKRKWNFPVSIDTTQY